MARAQRPVGPASHLWSALYAAALLSGLSACGDDDTEESRPDAGESDGGDKEAVRFLLQSSVSTTEETSSYVTLLDSLDGQEVDYGTAREFGGSADLWEFGGKLYVATDEDFTIYRYRLEGGELVEEDKVGFGSYGLTSFGFWINHFVSDTKAYLLIDGVSKYVVWNPTTMTIDGEIELPELKDEGELKPQGSYSDRSVQTRGKYMYQPVYWADADYFNYTTFSRIFVVDTEKNELVDTLEVDCPGLDFATTDDDGNIYFSSWIFAPGGAAVLNAPDTCVAKIPAKEDLKVEVAFKLIDVTDGRQGGALRYVGDGKAYLSVLHDDEARKEGKTDVEDIAYGPYWRFWSLDLKTLKAEQSDAIDWNSGAAYSASVGDREFILVPTGSYTDTVVYELSPSAEPKKVLEAGGWAMRLVGVE